MSAAFKGLLIKCDTGPLTYNLHARVATNRIEVWLLSCNFALVFAAGMQTRVLQKHLLVIRMMFLQQKRIRSYFTKLFSYEQRVDVMCVQKGHVDIKLVDII